MPSASQVSPQAYTVSNFTERLAELPDLLAGHMRLSASALILGVGLSLPLGIFAARWPRLRTPVLGATALIQTIPSLALLAFMVPLLGGRIGFVPALIALTLYAMLPVLHNTVTGLAGVDADLTEAARGVGMTPRQSLWRVELPLAAPVILAGIRTASVWVIGTATLATPVGAESLGNYIFMGLQTRNGLAVAFGCVAASLLAVFFDLLIRLLERAARLGSPKLGALGATGLALLVAICLGWIPFQGVLSPERGDELESSEFSSSALPSSSETSGDSSVSAFTRTLTVGSKGFTEQYILADLIQGQLNAAGFEVDNLPNMGSTILFDALSAGTVDVCVDYTGTVWATILGRTEPVARIPMQIEVASELLGSFGIVQLGPLGFENAYAFAMDGERASELGITSIQDLARVASAGTELTIGGDSEFFGRPEWLRVRSTYGLESLNTKVMDSTFLYGAAVDGQVDVITAYTTDGRIDAFELLLLDDPAQALPPYDAILLLSPQAAGEPRILNALRPLLNSISNEAMRAANRAVDLDGATLTSATEILGERIPR